MVRKRQTSDNRRITLISLFCVVVLLSGMLLLVSILRQPQQLQQYATSPSPTIEIPTLTPIPTLIPSDAAYLQPSGSPVISPTPTQPMVTPPANQQGAFQMWRTFWWNWFGAGK